MVRRSETLVFVGTQAQKLRYSPAAGQTVVLQAPKGSSVAYEEGSDYRIDYEAGTIARMELSRIPDWREHPMHGKLKFDHREYASYSNAGYTCTFHYDSNAADEDAVLSIARMNLLLPRLSAKLAGGEAIRYVVYGDSISTGKEASAPELAYHEKFAAGLRALAQGSDLEVLMKAIGGEASGGGLARLQHDVLDERPDLVTIGYGMNDQNLQPGGSNATELRQFEHNIQEMTSRIKHETMAEVILLTPCLPNPRWHCASDNVQEYAEAIRRVGRSEGVPVADVQQLWLTELAAGKSHESLLLNNLNHPNDYGHALYYRALLSLF